MIGTRIFTNIIAASNLEHKINLFRSIIVTHPSWIFRTKSQNADMRPMQFHAIVRKPGLKILQKRKVLSHLSRLHSPIETKRRQCSRSLSNIPFHRMQPVAAVRDMSNT